MKSNRVFIFVFIMILLILIISIYAIGPKGGFAYFNPGDLKLYEQDEILLLFTELPIYRSRMYSDYEYEIMTYILKQGWVKREPKEKYKNIFGQHWNQSWKDGSSIFHSYMCQNDEYYVELAKKNPEMSKIFWKDIISKLRDDFEYHRHYINTMLFYAQHFDELDDYYKFKDMLDKKIL